MARPVVSDTAEDLYASLGAYTVGDEDQGWDLLNACEALCLALVEPIAELVQERDDRAPWQVLFDPALCPVEHLPYLAQFVGVTLESNLTEQEMRDKIALPEGFKRGTPAAMLQAIQRTLTGTRHVVLFERDGGNAYQLAVRTQTAETPDAAATEAATITQKPVGIVLDYQDIVGATYLEVDAAFATYAAADAANADYAALLLNT